MGTSFGTIHVRTTDRAAVQMAAEVVAAQLQVKFYLAPVIDSWTTLIPSGHGQGDKPARELAAVLPQFEIFQVILHDSDVFAYNFFRDGHLRDEYSSSPDYFETVSKIERDRLRGRPNRFADLLGPNLKVVDTLLHQPTSNAHTRFNRFAQLLHLPNAATAFEYLQRGEGRGIARFNEFLQIPDPSAEIAAQRRQRAVIAAQVRTAKSQGRLLAEYIGSKSRLLARYPVLAPVGDSEFLLTWGWDHKRAVCAGFPASAALSPRNPRTMGMKVNQPLNVLSIGSSGRRALIGFNGGKSDFELWDLSKRRRIANSSALAKFPHCISRVSRWVPFYPAVHREPVHGRRQKRRRSPKWKSLDYGPTCRPPSFHALGGRRFRLRSACHYRPCNPTRLPNV